MDIPPGVSHAATEQYNTAASPNTSQPSALPYGTALHSSLFWREEVQDTVPLTECAGEMYKYYDLKDICDHFGSSAPSVGDHKDSAEACQKLLRTFIPSGCNVDIFCKRSLPLLNKSLLAAPFISTDVKPDLYLHCTGDIAAETAVEIHSSPFEDTLRKTVYVGTEILRVRKLCDERIDQITLFCFPKLPNPKRTRDGQPVTTKQCVVKVVVTWRNFCMCYALTPLVQFEDVKREICAVVRAFQRLDKGDMYDKRVVIRLSVTDLEKFGDNAQQLPSDYSLVVRSNNKIFKRPLVMEQNLKWDSFVKDVEILRLKSLPLPTYVITPIDVVISDEDFFRYDCAPYHPMTILEARKCLKEFFVEMCQAIKYLHEILLKAHMDIRLENVCFTERFRPILIDVDRSERAQRVVEYNAKFKTCLVNLRFNTSENDWIQLGWMVAWVLHQGDGEYHQRTFESLPSWLKSSSILTSLIQNGRQPSTTDDAILNECNESLESVLTARGHT